MKPIGGGPRARHAGRHVSWLLAGALCAALWGSPAMSAERAPEEPATGGGPPMDPPATEERSGMLRRLVDPADGQLDLSEVLSTAVGFLPVPIIITEPAVGYGGGLTALFLHDPFAGVPIDEARSAQAGLEEGESPRRKPPDMTFVGGGGTENGSWFAGAGHQGFWLDDRVRYTGGLLYSSIHLDYYGPGGRLPAIPFHIEGLGMVQELKGRLRGTDLFVGLRYLLFDSTVTVAPGLVPELGRPERRRLLSGIGPVATFTTLDNVLTPRRGVDLDLRAMVYRDALGSDYDYEAYDAVLQTFLDPHPRLVVGAVLDGRFSTGEPPFWTRPYVRLRGVPALRYQGDHALSGEVELRWRIAGRWSVVGFGGVGGTFPLDRNDGAIGAGGGGFRYLIARLLGLEVGVDVARGPEETVVYIQVGNAWGGR